MKWMAARHLPAASRGQGLGVRGLMVGAAIGVMLASPAAALEVGERGPDSRLAARGGRLVTLADLLATVGELRRVLGDTPRHSPQPDVVLREERKTMRHSS